ncbi:AAA family ATPase [Oceanicoccus sp. KOV_DT_Chl]|uniref:nucleotide-binding protein n=1 Tax=Oceanicoccus sp. KOV_DT_Chl TaxID=1904639 RepID=UPI00190E8956|nr:AAA family ATPase [Oceanicoccus sp. KOV_DT_Chl]
MTTDSIFRVAIVNSKGGSGKTTLATNLASYYSSQQLKTVLIDYDSQGSSSFWVSRRPESCPDIQIISAYKQPTNVTRNWFLRPERATQRAVIDSPSGLDVAQFKQTLLESDAILIPVLPSSIDIHAVAHFIADILLQGKIRRDEGRVAVIANRVRKNTLVYHRLEQFLNSLGIPFIASLRDTQQYIKASEVGKGIFEMPRVDAKDVDSWQPLLNWLDQCEKNKSSKPQFSINS